MPNNALTAVRSNSMPVAGPTAQQPVPPTLLPADLQALIESMTPTITKFRQASSPNEIALNQQTLSMGQSDSVPITSVGLGYRLVTEHTTTITLDNTASSAQTYQVSDKFPYNLIDNTTVDINGGAKTYSASGVGGLLVAVRGRRGALNPSGTALNAALVGITLTNVTSTASTGFTLSGYASFNVAATTTGTIVVKWIEFQKLAFSRDTLIGALPLQNKQTECSITRTMKGSLTGTNNLSPIYVAGGFPSTTTVTVSDVVQTTYKFWSVPTDPALYQDMVMNSYQILEQPKNVVNNTGSEALVYNIPNNAYLTALHMLISDTNGNYVSTPTGIPKYSLTYSGSVLTPARSYGNRRRAEEWLDYGSDLGSVSGYLLWDGSNTTDDLNTSDEAGWLNTYTAASPQLIADVADTLATPLNFSVTREQIVADAVNQIA